MEAIRQWGFGVCAACVACGMMRLLMPEGGMRKVFQTALSVFFLCCLLSPALFPALAVPDLAESEQQIREEVARRSEQLESVTRQEGAALAQGEVRRAAQGVLEEAGVAYEKISVNVHDVGDGSISISTCEVYLDRKYLPRHDQLYARLTERLGVEVRMEYVDDPESEPAS